MTTVNENTPSTTEETLKSHKTPSNTNTQPNSNQFEKITDAILINMEKNEKKISNLNKIHKKRKLKSIKNIKDNDKARKLIKNKKNIHDSVNDDLIFLKGAILGSFLGATCCTLVTNFMGT